jgi:tetratricopeptide (TPR) repeat protein
VEVQFLQLQFARVSELFERMAATRQFVAEDPNDCHVLPFQLVAVECEDIDDLVTRILRMKRQLTETPDDLTFQEGAMALHDLSLRLPWHMSSQQVLIANWATRLYRLLARKSPEFLPWLAHAMTNLARYHVDQSDFEKAHNVIEEACKMWDIVCEKYSDQDYKSASVYATATLGWCLMKRSMYGEAVEVLEEASTIYKDLLEHLEDENSIYDEDQKLSIRMRHQWCFDDYTECLLCENQPDKALEAAKEILKSLPTYHPVAIVDNVQSRMNRALASIYMSGDLRFIQMQELARLLHEVVPPVYRQKLLYTNFMQRLAYVTQDGIDLTGTVQRRRDTWGGVQSPFETDPSWMLRNFAGIKQLPNLFKEQLTQKGMSPKELMIDLFSAYMQNDTYMMVQDYHLLALIVKEYEEEAMAAMGEVFGTFLSSQYKSPTWGLIHSVLRSFSSLQTSIQLIDADQFLSKLLSSSSQLVKQCLDTTVKEPIIVQLEVAVALRINSTIFMNAKQYQRSLECIDQSLKILRATELDSYHQRDLIESLWHRNEYLRMVGREEESLKAAREAYELSKALHDSTEGFKPTLTFATDIGEFMKSLVTMHHLPPIEQVVELIDVLFATHNSDPYSIYGSSVWVTIYHSLLTLAWRARSFGKYDCVTVYVNHLVRLWAAQNTVAPDNIALALFCDFVQDICWQMPPAKLAEFVDSLIAAYSNVLMLMPGPVNMPFHNLAWASSRTFSRYGPTKHRRFTDHGVVYGGFYTFSVFQDSIAGVVCALSKRAATLGLEDALLLRKEVVRINEALYRKELSHGSANSYISSLRALILTLKLHGGAEQEIEEWELELSRIEQSYPELDELFFYYPPPPMSPPLGVYDDGSQSPYLRPSGIQEIPRTPSPGPTIQSDTIQEPEQDDAGSQGSSSDS